MCKFTKNLLAYGLLTAMVICSVGCGGTDGLSLDNTGKSSSGSAAASVSEEPEEPAFENKAEVSIYKAGSDQILFVVSGEQCKGLVSDDVHSNSDRQFLIQIGKEITEVIPQEEFAARGIEVPEPEAGEDPITEFELTTFDLHLQANFYSNESTAIVPKGDDWEHYKTKFDDGSTFASDTAYFTTVSAPDLCNLITAGDKYLLYYQKADAEDLSEDDLIAMGTVKDVVKEVSEEDFITYKGPVYLSGKPFMETKLDWAGTWRTDSNSDLDGTLEITVTDKGIIAVHVLFPDTDCWYYGEEGSYFEESYSNGTVTQGKLKIYNIRNGSDRLMISYEKAEGYEPNITYYYDDFNTIQIRAYLQRAE
ncbi:MAG: hypothetical protein K6E19_09660 [Lachnospiraceae bacterium]|nr:hypothetical protein [Lachnospiraceae bacterium]